MVRYRAMVAWNSLPQYLITQMYTISFSKGVRLFISPQEERGRSSGLVLLALISCFVKADVVL